MAASKKKRVVDKDLHSLEHESDNIDSQLFISANSKILVDGEQEMDTQEEVQVDFEARNPDDSDFHGMKKLLQQLFLKANINLSEMTDTIISQNYVGSVIKQNYIPDDSDEESDEDDDLDVFGMVTVINITERQNLDSIKQLKSYLLEKCSQCSVAQQNTFKTLLQDPSKQVGFLVNERLINIPPQIALPSFQSLWKEVDKAKKKKMKYDFTEFIMISKTYRMPDMGQGHMGKKHGGQPDTSGMTVFVNPEEEYFHEESVLTFEYSVQSERDTAVGGQWGGDDDEMEPYRTVMVIPQSKMQAVMDKLASNLAMT